MRLIEDGSPRAPIWLVGEAPGRDEVERGRPFVGASGYELDKMLSEAGIARSDCFLTNVCHDRPPSYTKNGKVVNNDIGQWFCGPSKARSLGYEPLAGRYCAPEVHAGYAHVHELLRSHTPRVIVLLGNTPLWALAGEEGITKWRGSVFSTGGSKSVATFHPADILRQWTHRPIAVQDFRRAAREAETPSYVTPADAYGWEFVTEPTREHINDWFATHASNHDAPLVCDTEGWGRVDCIGFASDHKHAICIPFTRPSLGESYWAFEDELGVTQDVREVLHTRPTIFHNALWDCQVIARRWGMMPRLHGDTQVAQHVAFPGLLGGKIDPVTGQVDKKGSSLSLSFIASMYCRYYRYWKDDGRLFDPAIHDERQYWSYNCEDCVRTYECWEVLSDTLTRLSLRDQFEFEMRLFAPVFAMMFRGIRYDAAAAVATARRLREQTAATRSWLNTATGCDFNPDSTPQMRALFYDDLRLPVTRNRKTGSPTLDDATLDAIGRKNPLLRPLVTQIQNYRTLDTLRGALDARVCDDGRFRCALNVAFVETFRFSSNETAFGEGGNLQNIKRPD